MHLKEAEFKQIIAPVFLQIYLKRIVNALK